jgi:hypothetical protein
MMLVDLVLVGDNLDTVIRKFTIIKRNFTIFVLANSILVEHNLCVMLADLVLVVGNFSVVIANLVLVVINFNVVVAIPTVVKLRQMELNLVGGV